MGEEGRERGLPSVPPIPNSPLHHCTGELFHVVGAVSVQFSKPYNEVRQLVEPQDLTMDDNDIVPPSLWFSQVTSC